MSMAITETWWVWLTPFCTLFWTQLLLMLLLFSVRWLVFIHWLYRFCYYWILRRRTWIYLNQDLSNKMFGIMSFHKFGMKIVFLCSQWLNIFIWVKVFLWQLLAIYRSYFKISDHQYFVFRETVLLLRDLLKHISTFKSKSGGIY